MCLFAKGDIQTFTYDIVCYKVIEDKYKSPIIRYDYQEYIESGEVFVDTNTIKQIDQMLGKGYIHSFNSIRACEKFIVHYHIENPSIYKCEIPAGTPYYEGMDLDTREKGFCSKAIKFIEEI